MLSHLHRFHGHGSLRYVYRHGRGATTGLIGVKYSRNPGRVHSRFAVIISKKVFKSAVKRNRLRRRIYPIIRQHVETIERPYDIVLTVFSGTLLDMPPQELNDHLLALLAKESLIR